MIEPTVRFALVSHILPPSSSGQAVMLYRLLNDFSPNSYCLINTSPGGVAGVNDISTEKLPANHYSLGLKFNIRIPGKWILRIPARIASCGTNTLIQGCQMAKIIKKEKCRVLIPCTGNFTDMISAFIAKLLTGVHIVPYIFDDFLYREVQYDVFMINRLFEPVLMKKSSGIIVTNEFMERELARRYGVKSTLVRNPCSVHYIQEQDAGPKVFHEEDINIVYAGAIYQAHYDAFKNLITAIKAMNRPDIKLHLFTGHTASELEAAGIAGKMVVHHPHVPQSEIIGTLKQADILFLPLAFDSPYPMVIKTSSPGKIGDFLAIGKPILVHAPEDSFISWYFRENKCGFVVDRSDAAALSEALVKIISDKELQSEMAKQAISKAWEDYDISVVRTKFARMMAEISKKE